MTFKIFSATLRWAVPAMVSALALTSCFKDEPLNAEADILQVTVPMTEAQRQQTFFADGDAVREVLSNYAEVVFAVREDADLTHLAPEFTLSPGATVEPASGTVLDFSQQQVHRYTVTSQDGQWQRTYSLSFQPVVNPTYFSLNEHQMYISSQNREVFHLWKGLCTANEGFMMAKTLATQNDYPTVACEGYQGDGVLLRTLDTGIFGKLKKAPIAAGNLFLGEFDMSEAFEHTLLATHFGVRINRKPLRFSGWYKYRPGEKDLDGNPFDDTCAIYAIVYKNHDAEGNAVMLTGEDIMTNPNRVAMAKFYDIPNTEVWTYFDLSFDYKDEIDPVTLANAGYSLTMVCSSSADGDHFRGAINSSLWVDELKISYAE